MTYNAVIVHVYWNYYEYRSSVFIMWLECKSTANIELQTSSATIAEQSHTTGGLEYAYNNYGFVM